MVILILGVVTLYIIQTFLPSALMPHSLGVEALNYAGGPRDEPVKLSQNAARAKRALHNMTEALFVFLPSALLAVHFGLNDGLAWWGALVFLIARILYIPAYILAIGLTRSVIWTIGHAGLVGIAVAVFNGQVS